MGIAGITLSTSFITLFNATMLGIFMSKRIKLDYKTLFINFGKMLLAGAITLALGWFICTGFDTITLPKYVFEIVKIAIVVVLCSILYLVLNLIFKMDYAKELINRIKR